MILQLCGLVDCCFGFELKCVLSPANILAKSPTHRKSLFSNQTSPTINRKHRNNVTQVKRNTSEVRFGLIVVVVALLCPSPWSKYCGFVVVA
jgi:hypothetical protein